MQAINPNHQNIQINLRSDDEDVQGNVDGDVALSFQFNRTIEIPTNYVLNVSVARAEIPISYYSFDFAFQMAVNWSTGGTAYEVAIDIPKQHWSPCLIVNYIKKELIDLKPSGSAELPILSFDCNTLKYTLADGVGNDPGDTYIEFRISATTYLSVKQGNALKVFFGMVTNNLPNQPIVAYPINFVNVADAARLHTISITSKLLNTNSIDSRSGGEHVLAKVPVNAPFGSILLYKGNLIDGYLYRQQSLNRIDLALRDHYGDLIKLNGGRYNVSLICQFVRKNDDIFHDLPMGLPIPTPAGPTIGYETNVDDSLSYKKRLVDYMRRRRRRSP